MLLHQRLTDHKFIVYDEIADQLKRANIEDMGLVFPTGSSVITRESGNDLDVCLVNWKFDSSRSRLDRAFGLRFLYGGQDSYNHVGVASTTIRETPVHLIICTPSVLRAYYIATVASVVQNRLNPTALVEKEERIAFFEGVKNAFL